MTAIVDELVHQAFAEHPGPRPSSWAPIDWAPVLDGEQPDEAPSMLLRTDGVALAYPGKIHSLHGPPESLKSWIAQLWCVEQVRLQRPVAYLDFETSPRPVARRLQALGLDAGQLEVLVRYVRPTDRLDGAAVPAVDAAIEGASLVVVDGVTEALGLNGFDLNSNKDVAIFFGLLPRRAAAGGAAVALIDHVVKDTQARGRYAVGAGHKLAAVDVAYSVEPIRSGLSRLELAKDRDGAVRELIGGGKRAGEVVLESGDDGIRLEIRPLEGGQSFRPTVLMERVSRHLEETGEQTKRAVLDAVSGKRDAKGAALDRLVAEGYVGRRASGRASLHRSVRPFRNTDAAG